MRVVFLGSGAFGLPTLERLSQSHEVVGIVTQPDQRAGRGKKMTPTPIGAWADEHLPGVPLMKPENINTDETRELVRSWDCDAWVVIAFGQKLGRALLADRFAINLHASLLPRWRGAAPINHAILAGDTVTGNSVITLADRMDAGLVLGQSDRAIEPGQTKDELHDLLAEDGPALIEQVLAQQAAGSLTPVTQDESRVTLAGKLAKADGWVDFDEPADAVRCRINGLSPWPGVSVGFRGERVRLLQCDRAEALGVDAQSQETATQRQAGEVIDPARGLISCGGGSAVRILIVQPTGKKPMPFDAFANGRQIKAGDRFTGGPAEA